MPLQRLIMGLVRFDPVRAIEVSSWARTGAEALAWCSRPAAPVPPEEIAAWGAAPGVIAYGFVDGENLVGYGELWVDDGAAEVEVARLIVAPDHRGRGVGGRLAAALADEARRRHPLVFLRVRPGNEAALRCYAAAGFRRRSPAEERDWNAGQPVNYIWLTHERPLQ